MSYKVKLNIFEGPLDLLLFLIKKEKIDIYDIPIARITRQYLEYMEIMQLLDLEIAGEFLVMAATLMHIKSKMLLPQEEGFAEEEEEEDPRDELVRRLLEYKKYKEAASRLHEMHDRCKDVFIRKGSGAREKIVSADGTEYLEASLFDLITALRNILKRVPKETFHKVIRNEFTVSDKIHEILHALSRQNKVYFSSLFRKARNKNEVIVIFLAVLELMKMREIMTVQRDSFSEIEIIRNTEDAENNA
ncbi:MAG: segregation/condensation protein A [Candidatus Omnitrophota bacterium]